MKEKVFSYLRSIPKGKVVTYGQIAAFLGNPYLARVVGNILHGNPDGSMNPCFKVVDRCGRLSEHYAFGGMAAQEQRLKDDGISVNNGRVCLAVYQWRETEHETENH